MKVGLVLGAGGVVGASWLIGALEALASETGWDPARADHIVGTSAGSVIGALCAAQVSAEEMGARVAGRALAEVEEIEDRAQEMAERSLAAEYRPALALPPLGPGSWRLAVATLRHPPPASPGSPAQWLAPPRLHPHRPDSPARRALRARGMARASQLLGGGM